MSGPARPPAARWHAAGAAWRRWRHSIRWRLVTLFLLLAAATTAVFVAGTQQLLRGAWLGYAKPLSADYLDRLADEIGSPPDVAKAEALASRLPISVRIEGPQVQFDSRGTPAGRQPEAGHRPFADPWGAGEGPGGLGLVRRTADGHRIVFGPGEPQQGRRPRVFGWLSLAVLAALTAAAYLAVRRLLRPLDDIGRGALSYGRGDFSQPIPVRRDDELGDLARRINQMADGLRGMLEAKRTLLLAISHELRSPLTRARLNAELIDDSEARQALLRDLAEMRDLVTDLLESERLASGHAALHTEPLDIGPWLREQAAAWAEGGAPLALQVDDDLGVVQADPARLRLLLRNLVDNARRHGSPAGAPAPRLFARRDRLADGGVELHVGVRDFGPGVPPEHLQRLTEAFYRTDAARQRATGGVGLGLHLARQVAQAHGGRLVLRNAQPGLEVTLHLPVAAR